MGKRIPKEVMIIYETAGQPAVFITPDKIVHIDLSGTHHTSAYSSYHELIVLIDRVEGKTDVRPEEFTDLYHFFLKFNFYQNWPLVPNEFDYTLKNKYFDALTLKTPELFHTIMESDEFSLANYSDRQVFQLLLTRFRMLMTKAEKPSVFQQAMTCY